MLKKWISSIFGLALGLGAALTSARADDRILVFGGTSGCGLETVKLLRGQGRDVTVFVRPTSNLEGLEPLGVSYVVGDALNDGDVAAAFASGSFTAVVSSLGGRPGEPRPDYVGNRNINESALAAGVKRVIQVSAIGVDDAPTEKPDPGDYMGNVMYEKRRGEDHLIASGLDYTIIRPGGLIDGLPTGKGELLPTNSPAGSIMRSDVALLVVQALEDDGTIGRIYNAVDPTVKDTRPGAEEINRQIRERLENSEER